VTDPQIQIEAQERTILELRARLAKAERDCTRLAAALARLRYRQSLQRRDPTEAANAVFDD